MIRFVLAFLAIVGLPTSVLANECERKWSGLNAESIAAFEIWALSWEAFDARRSEYDSLALARAIYVNHVAPNCSAAFAALGMSEEDYLRHLIGQNFATAQGGFPESIPMEAMTNRLAGPGLALGLPVSRPAAPVRAAGADPAPRATRPIANRVVPGCPSCAVGQAD
jgi:hypothetical protein